MRINYIGDELQEVTLYQDALKPPYKRMMASRRPGIKACACHRKGGETLYHVELSRSVNNLGHEILLVDRPNAYQVALRCTSRQANHP